MVQQQALQAMKDPCSLSMIQQIKENYCSRPLERWEAPPGRLRPGLAPQYKVHVDELQHGQQKGPAVVGCSTQSTRRRLGELDLWKREGFCLKGSCREDGARL